MLMASIMLVQRPQHLISSMWNKLRCYVDHKERCSEKIQLRARSTLLHANQPLHPSTILKLVTETMDTCRPKVQSILRLEKNSQVAFHFQELNEMVPLKM